MAKPFDATTKQIVEVDPQDWLELLGLPRLQAHLVDADLSTVTTDADRILRVTEQPERLFHFEFESGRDASQIARRLHRYNVLVDSLYGLPVASIVFLLNHEASRAAEVTGYYERTHPDTGDVAKFWYRAIRVWELPVADLLIGGVATLPLALLSNLAGADPAQVVAAMHKRIVADATSEDDREIVLTGAYILAGLRFSDTMVQTLFEGILNMEESSTYQAILMKGEARGRVEEARRLLILTGRNRLGVPSPGARARIDAIVTIEQLEQLFQSLSSVESWDDLLGAV